MSSSMLRLLRASVVGGATVRCLAVQAVDTGCCEECLCGHVSQYMAVRTSNVEVESMT